MVAKYDLPELIENLEIDDIIVVTCERGRQLLGYARERLFWDKWIPVKPQNQLTQKTLSET